MRRKYPALIRVPKSFVQLIDEARVQSGYHGHERIHFLEDLTKDDEFKKILRSRKKGGGDYFAF